jgi:hypothetical protein
LKFLLSFKGRIEIPVEFQGACLLKSRFQVREQQAKALAAVGDDEEDVDVLLAALQMDTGVDWCVV